MSTLLKNPLKSFIRQPEENLAAIDGSTLTRVFILQISSSKCLTHSTHSTLIQHLSNSNQAFIWSNLNLKYKKNAHHSVVESATSFCPFLEVHHHPPQLLLDSPCFVPHLDYLYFWVDFIHLLTILQLVKGSLKFHFTWTSLAILNRAFERVPVFSEQKQNFLVGGREASIFTS